MPSASPILSTGDDYINTMATTTSITTRNNSTSKQNSTANDITTTNGKLNSILMYSTSKDNDTPSPSSQSLSDTNSDVETISYASKIHCIEHVYSLCI